METSDVRRRVGEAIAFARQAETQRRTRTDQATRAFDTFLERVATPLFRQVANVLKVQGYAFTVSTPGASVRLTSERNARELIELILDTSGDTPLVVGHVAYERGHRVVETERPIAEEAVEDLTEEHVLAFVLKELEPFVER